MSPCPIFLQTTYFKQRSVESSFLSRCIFVIIVLYTMTHWPRPRRPFEGLRTIFHVYSSQSWRICYYFQLKSECVICPCNFVISYFKFDVNFTWKISAKDLNCETLVCRWSCGATVLIATHWDESLVRSELYKRQPAFKQVIFSLPAEPTRCSDSLLWWAFWDHLQSLFFLAENKELDW